jgi:hypothetical protein
MIIPAKTVEKVYGRQYVQHFPGMVIHARRKEKFTVDSIQFPDMEIHARGEKEFTVYDEYTFLVILGRS